MEKTVNDEPVSNENKVNQETEETKMNTTESINNEVENNENEDSTKKKNKDYKKLESENKDYREQLDKLQAKHDEINEKYLRMLAEYDNFRRRSAKEREGVYTEACSDAVAEFLPVLDNLERAVQFADEKSVTEGLALILKSFKDTFEKLGVKEVESLGKTFDPNIHNAILHIEDDSFGESEIVEVFQKCYTKDGKIIRCAMVKVAN